MNQPITAAVWGFLGLAAIATSPGTEFLQISADTFQEGNPPQNAFDESEDTRWAAQGKGRWIQGELGEARTLKALGVGFSHAERDYAFEIATSVDGETWSASEAFQSRGARGVKTYAFPERKTRFVRITVMGSNRNDWANVHTVRMDGVAPWIDPQRRALEVTTWAQGPKVVNGVGLSLDDHGRAYVTTVHRRKQSSLDIRNHQDLVKEDLSWRTVEDRRRFYQTALTGKRWLPDRNGDGQRDWRDLTVQKDTVTLAHDSDEDGQAETVRVLDEYHSEVTGIAAGVLAVEDTLFVAVEPDFLRYTNVGHEDFRATREVVATGLQVHMGQGGHNLSGVTLGPDGRVYWSLADKGHHVVTKEGKTYHRPNSGAIFRCEMDGTQVERFSTGERNAQELAFDAQGNLFSMDNDGDYPGEMERALYITEGSEHGWRLNWQWLRKQDFIKISGIKAYNPWMDERLFLPDHETHAAYLTPTLGNFGPGPCGFVSNPGTALSLELSDAFFMSNQKGEVRVFRFQAKGAFFTFDEGDPLKGGANNTGLAFGPDGALYAASYGNAKGAIYRFDVPEAKWHPLRRETREILGREVSEVKLDTLGRWLHHADQRVRMKGQFELVRRGEEAVLEDAVKHSETLLGRLHAVWGLGQITRRDPSKAHLLEVAWKHEDPEVRAQAAKVTGDLPVKASSVPRLAAFLMAGLQSDSVRLVFFSAIALGKLEHAPAREGLVPLLEGRGASDPYLRHAAVMGLAGALDAATLSRLATHPHRVVRLGAIVALRRQSAAEVSAFLSDADEMVLLEAARAIHDDASIPEALPDLAKLLEREGLKSEALMRRVINAAFRDGSDGSLRLLEKYLQRGEGSVPLRRTALASVLWWSQPPVLDAVEGRFRRHAPRSAESANAVIERLRSVIFEDRDLTEVLLNGVIERGERTWLSGVKGQVATWPASHQARLIKALARAGDPGLGAMVRKGLESPHAEVRETARAHADEAGVPLVELLLSVLEAPGSEGKGQAVLQLASQKDARATAKLAALADAYRRDEVDSAWKLELWQAATSAGIALEAKPDHLEYGGDPKRGGRLVREHAAAQCIRCHRMGQATLEPAPEEVAGIGPDLEGVGARLSRKELVASLLAPTQSIADGYGTVLIETKDGDEIAGVLAGKEQTHWRVTLADGTERKVLVEEIGRHTLTSTMPPMGLILTPEELRDVVSFLAEMK